MSDVEVTTVRGRKDVSAYLGVPEIIYRDDPMWTPQLRRSSRAAMAARRNPFHSEADTEHFVARDSRGQAVGRIAAIVHHDYVQRYGRRAFFGFFESVPEERVAAALLNAVEHWASERDMKSVAGPYSYTGTQEMGMLVEGFGRGPAVMQAYSPQYYPGLLLACGYHVASNAMTYEWHLGDRVANEEAILARGAEIVRERDLSVRSMTMSRFDADIEVIRQVFNRSFDDHPDLVGISEQVFRAQAEELRPIVDPDLVRIIERGGQPVAFVVLVPDLFEILPRRGGRVTMGLLYRLAMRRHYVIRGVRSAVVIMMGVLPEHAGHGIGRVLAAEIVKVGRSGRYPCIRTTWIHEDNQRCLEIVRQMETSPARRYAIWERLL